MPINLQLHHSDDSNTENTCRCLSERDRWRISYPFSITLWFSLSLLSLVPLLILVSKGVYVVCTWVEVVFTVDCQEHLKENNYFFIYLFLNEVSLYYWFECQVLHTLTYNVVKKLEKNRRPRIINKSIVGNKTSKTVETVLSLCFLDTSSGQTWKQMIYQREAY